MVAPKLRFKEFDEDWKLSTLSDISEIITGSTPSTSKSEYYDGNFLFVSPADIQENRYVEATKTTLTKEGFRKCRQIPNNSILFVCIGSTIGKIAQNKEICATNQQINAVVPNENHISDFLYLALDRIAPSIKLTAGIQAIPLINKTQFGKTTLSTPIFEEQTKIATFLSAVDEKIAQLSQKLHLLGQYKQGMMQKLFYQQIRFKADDGSEFGEWEIQPLNHYLYTSKLKNKDLTYTKYDVLSVSGEFGIVNQINLLGRSYAGVSVAPYGIVEVNDVVYTKSPLKSNPYGIIKVNQGKAGIVSTLYAVYKCKENIIPKLIEYYFQNDSKLNQLLKPLVKKGAKNDMKVNNDHVLTGKISFPASLEEQTKIANFLSAIDQKIDVVSEQLKQAKIWKKGLLQQMFV